jgi:hypothetical protein
MPTVFFSWQSDRGNTDKNFIERALESAIKRISNDLEIAEDSRDPLQLDKDTLCASGSPNIFDTIRKKIDSAAVFVADLTFISKRPRGEPSPNPNVLIEYGYAMKSLSSARIIGVMNSSYGEPSRNTLPFDLASYRFPITYELSENASDQERNTAREKLAAILERAVRDVLGSDEYKASLPKPEPPPPVKYREPQQGRARFWSKGEPVGNASDQLGVLLGLPGVPLEIADGPAIWLRVMPERPISTPLNMSTLWTLIPELSSASFYRSYSTYSKFIRGTDGVGLCNPFDSEPSPSLVYLFTDAEIWLIDTYTLRAMPKILSLEEDKLCETLTLLTRFLAERLKVAPPYRFVVGVEGVKGRSRLGPNCGLRGACATDLIEVVGTRNAGGDAGTALEPFFAKVAEQCGVSRRPFPS